jgi:hypothetical protein
MRNIPPSNINVYVRPTSSVTDRFIFVYHPYTIKN